MTLTTLLLKTLYLNVSLDHRMDDETNEETFSFYQVLNKFGEVVGIHRLNDEADKGKLHLLRRTFIYKSI